MDYYLRIICEVAQFAILVPLVFSFFRFKYMSGTFRQVSFLLFVLAIIGFTGYYIYLQGENNIPLMHLYTISEGLLWGLFYYSLFDHILLKRILIGFLVLIATVFICSTGSLELIWTVHYTNRLAESFVLFFCSIAWFYLALKKDSHMRQDDLFVLNIGVFIYGINNGCFSIARTWFLDDSTPLELWAIFDALLIVYYFLVTIAMQRNIKVPVHT